MTTKTDITQDTLERADFEAWAEKRGVWPRLTHEEIFSAGYQAGRAALQSQDRADALRYRWLRDNAQLFSHFGEEGNSGWCVMRRDSDITRVFTYNHAELDEAIDHARHIEGGSKP